MPDLFRHFFLLNCLTFTVLKIVKITLYSVLLLIFEDHL